MLKRLLRNEVEHQSTETCIIQPGSEIDIDTYKAQSGSYVIYIDLSELSNIDVLSIQVYLTPGPGRKEISYMSSSPKNNDSSLWMFQIPACSGFKIKYTLSSGKNLKIITDVWSK